MTDHSCTTLKPAGECYRCDLNRDEMGFEMYTDEGDAACQQLVDLIKTEVSEGKLTRNLLPVRVGELCTEVARRHDEIYDTEPQVHIAEALEKLCAEQGWVPVSREEW